MTLCTKATLISSASAFPAYPATPSSAMATISGLWHRLNSSLRRRNRRNASTHARLSRAVIARFQPPPRMSEIHQQLQSVFFSLPAELRLMVYDRVFALPAASAFDMVELEDAAKQFPTCSLLRTCKAINIEAKCYLKAYKKQWGMAAFIISNPYRSGLPQLLQALPIGACDAISRIRISGSGHELEYGVDHLIR